MSDLILPPGVDRDELGAPAAALGGAGMIVNETDLDDAEVQRAVEVFFEENASMLGANRGTSFQTYVNETGSLLARSKFKVPSTILEEIVLARDLAERDDDVAATIGGMVAVAMGEGQQHTHQDEVTATLFDRIAHETNLDGALKEIYREYLIAAQFTTVSLYQRQALDFQLQSADRQRTRSVILPRIAVLPAEQVIPLGDDTFGQAPLYFRPRSGHQETWLREFFGDQTSAGRKREMARENPVLTALLLEERSVTDQRALGFFGDELDPPTGQFIYRLNPRMAHRCCMPKGAWPHPRPLLTRNFPLLEAKRLLNVMDYALLEGGSNFLVVAKKGTDQRPAIGPEVAALRDTIRRASRSGVIVGDHRLNIEIITPQLTELLNPSKRRLIGRKLATAILRLPDYQDGGSGSSGQSALAEVEMIARVIGSDRRDIKLHLERHTYRETAARNSASFQNGPAAIWFPKIILQGAQFFTDMVLKLRDRGDIPRKFAVEAAGFDYQHAVAQRKLEKSNGDDKVLTPPPLPVQPGGMGGPGATGPQDNNQGRPRGSSPDNGAPLARKGSGPDPAQPKRVIGRNAGETVVAVLGEDGAPSGRVGELTRAVIEEYEDTLQYGRVTPFERRALEQLEAGRLEPFVEGPLTVVPVNVDEELGEVRAIRLTAGLSMLVSTRYDDAIMARALVFRTPEFRPVEAQETALRWGFDVGPVEDRREPTTPVPASGGEELAAAPAPQEIHVHVPGAPAVRKKLIRDEHGNLVGVEEERC